ncbi:glycosyltransferase family 2 protein [Flavobacterium ardleyense]|uniref:glycosyltransferase family 2 protein n=1 Tax=Flavobacterium ardleyense TaxID=2038737 RepID=UPI00298CB95C|nr:glycosyltransferase [Flavobacterium ardleyense]
MKDTATAISVIMITYNHADYISKAIEGVLMQKTNFKIELIISNDASRDATHQAIEKAIAALPENITVTYFNQTKNIGMMPNFLFVLQQAKSAYIAQCDGDDYWTDPDKLQKQFDFLEANPDYQICHHNVLERRGLKYRKRNHKLTEDKTDDLERLAQGNFVHSSSIMVRNTVREFPEYFARAENGDYFLLLLAARKGKLKYLNEVMSVYRIHNKSSWSSMKKRTQRETHINFLKNIQQDFTPEINAIFNAQIKRIEEKNYKMNHTLLGKIKTFLNP